MHLFYSTNINELFLDREESHHCTRVLRLKENDEIILIDGKGTFVRAVLVHSSEKKTQYRIIDQIENYNKLPYNLHLAVAPTKNIDRFEWFIEKATEIGVSEITPLLCEKSERKMVKKDRLEKLIIAAAKQSQKAYFPKLNEMQVFNDFLSGNKQYRGEKLIAHCEDGEKRSLHSLKLKERIIMCIGPEGDFSNKEIQSAIHSGFQPVTFGKSRLRTETAAVYACSAINLLNQKN